ncbi:tRNA epoxyqueuosine(34) reductase QueG [Thermogemmata fonticola]|uniref:tRNA epoxyqueuosine(34) reductase QueG n=1 Tax=Thermogemmata fonticola TaxID=2755323 RepID=A0A7V8VEA5_9BACT|nr:tRNA epoxyqueuosine(34) reductase QueG [Thermogemmata fonticola]MBA2226468.1 tRNA epoxyqueuosine(34) reductase QueG [Thermogemmata fonticola]
MATVPANIPANTRTPPLLPERLEERLRVEARRLGFSLCGIAPATEADTYAFYQHWLAQGYAGEMQYLHTRAEARRHPRSILQDVRSVVMLAMDYGPRPLHRSLPPSEVGSFPGRVAFYAAAPDYHPFLWQRLNLLADWLRQQVPGCQAVGVCDTAPLLERDFARRAGLGWIGKNTLLIHPRRGSFLFLAALLTDLSLQPDAPFSSQHCGTCTACLQACPTQAFPAPYVLDARRCISYLTIEHRSAIPATLAESIGDWLFGCDICQQVCPWNRKPQTSESPFVHYPEWEWLDPVTILRMDEATFRQRFRSTALWRAKRRGLRRNAAIVLGNRGDTSVLPVLQQAAQDADPLVRDAALWAISRIHQRYSISAPASSNNTTTY